MSINGLPQTEALEARRLLSGNFASVNSNGTLSVVGTNKADTINVKISGAKVQAILNNATESFTASLVKRIWIDGFSNNDKLINFTSLPSTLIGSTGNDTLVGGSGDDSLEGDAGFDTVDYSARSGDWTFVTPDDVLGPPRDGSATSGTETDDITDTVEHYIGSQQPDLFAVFGFGVQGCVCDGQGGDDFFGLGQGETATLYGGSGNDDFDVNDSGQLDRCYGQAGDDAVSLHQEAGMPYFDGGTGQDAIDLGDSAVTYLSIQNFPSVEDVIGAGGGTTFGTTIIGNDLNNLITATNSGGPVTLMGAGGNDTLIGGDLSDLLHGGSGNDTLIGGLAADTVYGDGADTLYGDSGTDTADYSDRTENLILHIDGQPDSGAPGEQDQIMGDVENIIGGSGNDFIAGNPSNNSLEGGTGNDTIWGSSGNDTLVGDAGHDQLHGQDGNDVLYGKDGQTDTLDGGDGTDKASRDNSASVKDQVLSIESFI